MRPVVDTKLLYHRHRASWRCRRPLAIEPAKWHASQKNEAHESTYISGQNRGSLARHTEGPSNRRPFAHCILACTELKRQHRAGLRNVRAYFEMNIFGLVPWTGYYPGSPPRHSLVSGVWFPNSKPPCCPHQNLASRKHRHPTSVIALQILSLDEMTTCTAHHISAILI